MMGSLAMRYLAVATAVVVQRLQRNCCSVTATGRGYVPAEPLAGSGCLAAYLDTKPGAKIAKYAHGDAYL